MNVKELQAFIRQPFAWPGGYPQALQMADGECIDAQAARENYRLLRQAMRDQAAKAWPDKSWLPVGVFTHWEGAPIVCAHSGRDIESAYGMPEGVDE